MGKKQQSRYIRNHISKHTKDISKAGNEKFGITNSLIIQAVNGSKDAQEKIGDMGIVGKKLQTAIPQIKEQLQEPIPLITKSDILFHRREGCIAVWQDVLKD
ncbi:MAG: hypothetical protein AAGC43_18300 [Bacteroidota bacterium]